MKCTVLIVDDDDATREALLSLLASAGYDACAYSSADAFLRESLPTTPCCLVLDMRMPHIDGFDVVRRLEQRGDTIPIIFISGHGTVNTTVQAMKAGAFEFLTKPVQGEHLFRAVDEALELSRLQIETRNTRNASAEAFQKLTAREREVLALTAGGLMNKQIADRLGISEVTVKVHKRHVMEKMQTRTKAELLLAAFKLNIDIRT